ncbi:hypothetical protein C2869_21520 [Saccharobesus litoralis]|uniref:MSHA biogenesis protein MshK n=1 Tax=Saccharobesus litoralis TaxID=2172099 RepID=A0A2S0VX71_9ALTE|nr:hypothetical protein [Saccharobesus litoralis]AWB68819.1 hypothetical protein C2869_21520 [Saccharobesus litoralis]
MKLIVLLGMLLVCAWASANIKPLKSDPTQPKVTDVKTAKGVDRQSANITWQLQAITLSEFQRNAIINGEVVQEGQRISQTTVVERIEVGRVVIRQNGRRTILSLDNADIKKPAGS